jgi:phosphoribosylanthranilate isomerase
MSAVRSKICGITRIEDALAAVEAGADAIGLVFYAKSPRAVSVQQARAIIKALPPFVTTVGLFVNASRCELGEILDAVPLDLLQFHGDETAEECEGWHRPYIKALRVKAGDDIAAAVRCLPERQWCAARYLCRRRSRRNRPGLRLVTDSATSLSKPLILAGGLTPDNVADAVARVRPYAVDVSGGVEASKGIKDHAKVQAFINAVCKALGHCRM